MVIREGKSGDKLHYSFDSDLGDYGKGGLIPIYCPVEAGANHLKVVIQVKVHRSLPARQIRRPNLQDLPTGFPCHLNRLMHECSAET